MSRPRQAFGYPFGHQTRQFSPPFGWQVDVAFSVEGDAQQAETVIDFVAFQAAAQQAERVLIVFTDATRQCPDRQLAEEILTALHAIDYTDDRIGFLCAVGMHRPSTLEEKQAKLGADIVARYSVDDHRPADVVVLGEIDGILVEVNKQVVEPNTLVVALGVVEPHQYAGYSGGAKTVVIGCGGANTIATTHGPRLLDEPGTRLGNIDGNLFQGFVRQAGAMAGLQWTFNVILDDQYRIVDRAWGPFEAVHDELVNRARQRYEVPVDAPYDVVLAGVGAPKDANLYQASRAATYIGLSAQPAILDGGVIIMPAPMPEGAGEGVGEQNFIALLRQYDDLERLMVDMRAKGGLPGQQRAYMIAQMLAKYSVIVVGAEDEQVVKDAHLIPAETVEQAIALAGEITGKAAPRMLVVPHALQTIPVPR